MLSNNKPDNQVGPTPSMLHGLGILSSVDAYKLQQLRND